MPNPDPHHAYHTPVLAAAVLERLAPRPGERFIDMTLGGGGHAAMLLEATAPDGVLLGIDRDMSAIDAARERLSAFGERIRFAHEPFDRVAQTATAHGFVPADGILMDVGVSSRQLDDPERGFSFRHDAPLDMRMDQDSDAPTAADLVNRAAEGELVRIFKEYGEERHARRIARAIAADREQVPFTTTKQLAELVSRVTPAYTKRARIHPATRVFQALRIAVNDELGMLDRGLDAAFSVLAPHGRMAVISFHSLEDRMVKRRFAEWTTGCICPKEFPVCRCGHLAKAKPVTRKAIKATAEEIDANPRARSARLRVISRLPEPDGTGDTSS